MINLPKWRLTNPYPAFHDSESGSAIEMTAKVYGGMRELIDEYNKFAESVENIINDFTEETEADHKVFETSLRQEFQDFIDAVDMRLLPYVGEVRDVAVNLLNEGLASGAFTIEAVYNEATESLDYVFTGKVV